jgi:hypothetical protein
VPVISVFFGIVIRCTTESTASLTSTGSTKGSRRPSRSTGSCWRALSAPGWRNGSESLTDSTGVDAQPSCSFGRREAVLEEGCELGCRGPAYCYQRAM